MKSSNIEKVFTTVVMPINKNLGEYEKLHSFEKMEIKFKVYRAKEPEH